MKYFHDDKHGNFWAVTEKEAQKIFEKGNDDGNGGKWIYTEDEVKKFTGTNSERFDKLVDLTCDDAQEQGELEKFYSDVVYPALDMEDTLTDDQLQTIVAQVDRGRNEGYFDGQGDFEKVVTIIREACNE